MRVFNETQKFDQWGMKLIYFSLTAMLFYFLYSWYIAKDATGNIGISDITGQLTVIVITVAVLLLFYIFKLRTEIDEVGIHYQFTPFHFSTKTIRWSEIKKCYVRKYSPISEYSGWGYKMSFGSGKAYNIKGNKGIQIELKTGKKILIGTQKAEDAQSVIHRNTIKNERV